MHKDAWARDWIVAAALGGRAPRCRGSAAIVIIVSEAARNDKS